jgi:hypothetical protein
MERPDKGHRAYRVMESDDDDDEEEEEKTILEWMQCMMTMTTVDIINIQS